jgi:hypothetical protein
VKTLIVTGGKVKTVTHRRIDQAHATRLADPLPLTATVADDDGIDLWPHGPLTTREAIRAQRVFIRATDAPIRWHDMRPPVRPTCVMCDATEVPQVHELCDGCAAMFSPSEVAG